MISCIIVDDEQSLGYGLKKMIENHHSDLTVSAICYNLEEAELALKKYQPGLVFLDVELGSGETSFDLLNKISPINFQIIFTTAHNQYAIEAIKFSAIDYLLKPLDEEELKAAIEKFRNKKQRMDTVRVESLLAALLHPGNQENKIHLPTKSGFEVVVVADIIFCQAVGGQTLISLINKKNIVTTLPLRQLGSLLSQYRFTQIHQLYLINLNHVKKYIKGKDGTVIVTHDLSLTVSRNFKEKFIERLKSV